MALFIIKRDGATIGAVEGLAQFGGLEWFAANVHAYSMAHACEHEGYSVEAAEEIDCHDVESILEAIAGRLGLTMAATFVPFSLSPNAVPAIGRDKPWQSLNWRVTIIKGGHDVLTTP